MCTLLIFCIMCYLMIFRSSQAAESFFEGLVNLFMHICAFLPLLFGIMILILSFQKLFS